MILMRAPKPYIHQEYPKWVDGVIVHGPEIETEVEAAEGAVQPSEDQPAEAKRKGGWPAGKPRKPREV